ncbi:YjcQ family protein [Enterococcus thailandicus]|uniref:YjcQ family protein n=1 Tax=Enterococcus thailandicus TaxID=417368 RepID=UPI0022E753CE|nr:YjcQ family protein [Enterococcus thailandicus]
MIKENKKIRYAILKEIDNGNHENLDFDIIGITEEQFNAQLNFLKNEGYIVGGSYGGNGLLAVTYKFLKLTEKGENFLEENSTFAKTYKVAKEIRDWIK